MARQVNHLHKKIEVLTGAKAVLKDKLDDALDDDK